MLEYMLKHIHQRNMLKLWKKFLMDKWKYERQRTKDIQREDVEL
ncbi:hypothetical protein OTUT144_0689 [Orientia tsutsugamushi str. UT144]|uniref:Transposase n=1 Tax=Orientia tsutsugamushi str. UT144 TaxID=1441384 RepID=A0A0F3RMM4_ORITS|nr:hypothetical protein OTUT144_0689 [Orientia tsutsugamushi str. UT144]